MVKNTQNKLHNILKNKFHMEFTTILFLVMCLMQYLFWNNTKNVLPKWSIVPEVPSQIFVKAMAFGDNQFIFRMLGLEIQNAGDSGGRFTSLRLYDYDKLVKWFALLDSLDDYSDYAASMAANYYGMTQKKEDIPKIINYIREHVARYPDKKWRWLAHAVYLAQYKMEDNLYALKIAKELANLDAPNAPMWTEQMPAFIMKTMGDKEKSRAFMIKLYEEKSIAAKLSKEEKRYMEGYIMGEFFEEKADSPKGSVFDPDFKLKTPDIAKEILSDQ
ncbi:MAG: hypothetical protein GY804_08185 [Alphaproteobacteria bacterium]|nr:hypothetical protein [Alphaproteobacteria bacterium]